VKLFSKLLKITGGIIAGSLALIFLAVWAEKADPDYLDKSDVVGTWRMTPESILKLTKDEFRPYDANFSITLRPDGTCNVTTRIQRSLEFSSGGSWELDHGLTTRNLLHFNLHSLPYEKYPTELFFTGEKQSRLKLCGCYLDPNFVQFVQLVEYTREP
jgi:hypothetical protein